MFLGECIRRSLQSAFPLPVNTYSLVSELEHQHRPVAVRLIVLSLHEVGKEASFNTLKLSTLRSPRRDRGGMGGCRWPGSGRLRRTRRATFALIIRTAQQATKSASRNGGFRRRRQGARSANWWLCGAHPLMAPKIAALVVRALKVRLAAIGRLTIAILTDKAKSRVFRANKSRL